MKEETEEQASQSRPAAAGLAPNWPHAGEGRRGAPRGPGELGRHRRGPALAEESLRDDRRASGRGPQGRTPWPRPCPRRACPYTVSAAPRARPEGLSSPASARWGPFQGRAPQRLLPGSVPSPRPAPPPTQPRPFSGPAPARLRFPLPGSLDPWSDRLGVIGCGECWDTPGSGLGWGEVNLPSGRPRPPGAWHGTQLLDS